MDAFPNTTPQSSPSSSDTYAPTDIPSMLKRAAQLMKDQDISGAKQLVNGVLKVTQANPDAWYLAAHLVEDPTRKKEALQRVLQIDPSHARAQQMLSQLMTSDDIFAGILPTATPVAQPYQQPVVHVHVNQANNNVLQAGIVGMPASMNSMAMIIGFVAAGFLGVFGVGHLFTGKIGGALGYFILGITWLICAGVLSAASGGICLFGAIPLHFYFAWTSSKKGATVLGRVI